MALFVAFEKSLLDRKLVSECSNHAVMVRVRGQDSLGVKTLGRPFHKMSGGFTTLSASGLLIDRRSGYVLTSATLLSPYMQGDSLRKGAMIEVLTNGVSGLLEEDEATPSHWIPMRLVRILRDEGMRALMKRFKGDADWNAGWPRSTDSSSGHLGEMDLARRETMSSSFWAGFEDVALLQVDFEQNDNLSRPSAALSLRSRLSSLKLDFSSPQPINIDLFVVDPSTIRRGNQLLLVASPYGILSPSVFHNCIYTTMASNIIYLEKSNSEEEEDQNGLIFNSTAKTFSNASDRSPTQQLYDSATEFIGGDSSTSQETSLRSTQNLSASPHPQTRSSGFSYQYQNSSTQHQQQQSNNLKPSRARRLRNAVLNSQPVFPERVPVTQSHQLKTPTIDTPNIILIDQAGLPGCEGGPVFDGNGALVGLLAPPLRRSDGSNVEVHIVIPIHPFLNQLRGAKNSVFKLEPVSAKLPQQNVKSEVPSQIPSQFMQNSTDIVDRALSSIVVISTGTFWGSGVVVSPDGYVLTSAHIFRSFLSRSSQPYKPLLKPGYAIDVRIDFDSVNIPSAPPASQESSSNVSSRFSPSHTHSKTDTTILGSSTRGRPAQWHRATLVFISSSYLDVALVRIDSPPTNLSVLPICMPNHVGGSVTQEPMEGENVLVLGFALFGPSKRVRASVTSGVISRVANVHGFPALIQTSAAVNKGASGGALIDSRGNFVGLVTCNAMTKDGVIIPKINFSIPAAVLTPIHEFVTAFRNAANRSSIPIELILAPLERHDSHAAALWSMSSFSDELDSFGDLLTPHANQPTARFGSRGRGARSLGIADQSSHSSPPNTSHSSSSSSVSSVSETQDPGIASVSRGTQLFEHWKNHMPVPPPNSIRPENLAKL